MHTYTYVYVISFQIYLICDNVESGAKKFVSMYISYAESQNKETPIVASVVMTIQWFYAYDVHCYIRDRLIYHERYYKIYSQTRFHIEYDALLSRAHCKNKK